MQKSKSLPVPFSLNAPKKLRLFRSGIPIRILKVAVYPGNVLTLHMSKPPRFNYKSGQYMFVKCATISSFEWHPFFITSNPSDDYLSVHIQTLGYWARQLKTIFSKAYEHLSVDIFGAISRLPRIFIDGPYSGQAQDYKKYKVVLLVGLGSGVTPMISIVKDIVNNMKVKEEEDDDDIDEEENEEEYGFENDVTLQKNQPGNNFRMTRAYLYQVSSEHGSFDWFIDVANEVAEMDKNGVIEMHNYCTSVYEEGDARSALITMLPSLNEAKNGVDVVPVTRVKTHFARPNWRNVYKQIARVHAGSAIGVFYCGKPTLAKELKELALEFSNKTSTKFHFYKEIF